MKETPSRIELDPDDSTFVFHSDGSVEMWIPKPDDEDAPIEVGSPSWWAMIIGFTTHEDNPASQKLLQAVNEVLCSMVKDHI